MYGLQQVGFPASILAQKAMQVSPELQMPLRVIFEVDQMEFFEAHEGLRGFGLRLVGNCEFQGYFRSPIQK